MEPILPSPTPERTVSSQEKPSYPEISGQSEQIVEPVVRNESQPNNTQAIEPINPVPPAPLTAPQDNSQVPPTVPVADEGAGIPKDWVDKAKKIVSSTKDNPHEQERQVSHLQADYLNKQFNKQIKVPE